ncbi:MAG: hypothetical protein JXA52_02740 [Planctomycetes bacterium]|nr:hypothetical protein [Planctomycetota bacterium]
MDAPAVEAEVLAETLAPETSEALSKDDLLNRIKIEKAKLTLKQAESTRNQAKVDWEETKNLFERRIYALDDLNKAQQAYEQADLKYQQAKNDLDTTKLEFLKDATLITVVDAKKYRAEDGRILASVTLRNDSDINKARVVMEEEDREFPESELNALLKIENVVVSLRSGAATIIGDPYQLIIEDLNYGEEKTLTFALLERDVEDITIAIEYLGEEKKYTVYLKKEAVQDLPTITTTQYAQQGELGNKVVYELEFERLAKTEQSFALVVLNLPRELSFNFLDTRSGARITQLKFTGDISKQNLNLEVSIPEKLDQKLVDSEINFVIIITRQAELKNIYALQQKYPDAPIPDEEITPLKGNRTSLILNPKGTGKLEILLANSYKEVKQGEPVSFKFSIINAGTLALRRITPELDLPLEWEGTLTPKVLEMIEPGEKAGIEANITPAADVSIGDYTSTIKCEGYFGIETIEAVDKDCTIHIAAVSNITATLMLVLVLVGLVLFIAVASIKISRR